MMDYANDNMTQNEKEYTLTFPFSGVKKEDISLQIEKGTLFLSAKRHIEIDSSFEVVEEEFSLDKEMKFSYTLGENVDPDKIGARMENGVLTVILGKKEEAMPKKVIIS